MKLIERLAGTQAIFLCPSCNKLVEKRIDAGLKYLSCGCARAINFSLSRRTHGFSCRTEDGKSNNHPLFDVLVGMKRRCRDKKRREYINYGAKGIVVCDEWSTDTAAFIEWGLANGYMPGLQIDRINNDGNYEPSNCRFISPAKNTRNSSTCKLSEGDIPEIKRIYLAGGISQKKLGEVYGVSQMTICLIVRGETWVGA